jgi:hypothetical protein
MILKKPNRLSEIQRLSSLLRLVDAASRIKDGFGEFGLFHDGGFLGLSSPRALRLL